MRTGRIKIIIVLAMAAALLVLLNYYSGGRLYNGISFSYSRPAARAYEKFSAIRNFFLALKKMQRFADENEQLKRENEKLLGQIAHLDALSRENAFLRNVLNLPRRKESFIAEASVYNLSLTPLGYHLTLNKGENDGIKVNDIVVSETGTLTGIIKAVFPETSSVRSVFDPEFKSIARSLRSGVQGIVQGALNGKAVMNFIAQAEDIARGDKIITTGDDQFPPGLLIGEVIQAKEDGAALFKMVEIQTAIGNMSANKVIIFRK